MRRFSALVATTVIASALATGCGGGGSSSSGYCSELKSSAATVKSFTADDSTPDFSKFSEFLDEAETLAKKAPSAVEDEWKIVLEAMDSLVATLDDAGLKIEDLPKLMSGQLPDGVDATKLTALGPKLQAIASDKVSRAGEAISKHAKDACGVDLNKIG